MNEGKLGGDEAKTEGTAARMTVGMGKDARKEKGEDARQRQSEP